MTSLLIALACLLAVVSIGLLRLRCRPRATQRDFEWLDSVSVDSYRVMERLLRSEDFQFLESQRGCSRAMLRRHRRQRRRILRAYLRQLHRDFGRIQAVARLKVACSPTDAASMSWFLLQSSLLFWLCRLRIEHALLLGGFAGAPVPQTGLLRACVETVLLHTRQIPVDRQLL